MKNILQNTKSLEAIVSVIVHNNVDCVTIQSLLRFPKPDVKTNAYSSQIDLLNDTQVELWMYKIANAAQQTPGLDRCYTSDYDLNLIKITSANWRYIVPNMLEAFGKAWHAKANIDPNEWTVQIVDDRTRYSYNDDGRASVVDHKPIRPEDYGLTDSTEIIVRHPPAVAMPTIEASQSIRKTLMVGSLEYNETDEDPIREGVVIRFAAGDEMITIAVAEGRVFEATPSRYEYWRETCMADVSLQSGLVKLIHAGEESVLTKPPYDSIEERESRDEEAVD